MKWMAWVAAVALAVPSVALARGRRSGGGSTPRYDPSTDFSRHFDDEVKYDREHPKADDDGDQQPPTKHRKSSRRKKKSAPPPDTEQAQESPQQ